MIQGDKDWIERALLIAKDDCGPAARYNLEAQAEHLLRLHLGPVPYVGALATAPVVLLLAQPEWTERAGPDDYMFQRRGWPLSALHPDAPAGVSEWWTSRTADLASVFGVQHVANSVAAVFLTPWRSARFDGRLRLPSRSAMLAMAEQTAARDATLVLLRSTDLWLECPAVAALPPTRVICAKSWYATALTPTNLGLAAWDQICRRIAGHAWLPPAEAGAKRDRSAKKT